MNKKRFLSVIATAVVTFALVAGVSTSAQAAASADDVKVTAVTGTYSSDGKYLNIVVTGKNFKNSKNTISPSVLVWESKSATSSEQGRTWTASKNSIVSTTDTKITYKVSLSNKKPKKTVLMAIVNYTQKITVPKKGTQTFNKQAYFGYDWNGKVVKSA